MNNYQKNAVYIAAALSLLMLAFPPLRYARSGEQPLKYDFFLTVFEEGSWYISVMDLTIQGSMLWGITALILLSLRNK